MKKELTFTKNLLKGRIAETIFEQMIQNEKRYTVIPFGYEHTMPTLAQYQQLAKVKSIIQNIANAPDFLLISEDHKQIFLVEVKYQKTLNEKLLISYSKKLLDKWSDPWLFVATSNGFYCRRCKEIIAKGKTLPLSVRWVAKERQEEYIKILNEFET